MAEALTANFRQRDFHAALVADHAAVLHALIFAAQTLPVGYRAKNARTKQSVALRFEGTVVDGLGLGDFAVRPAPDFFRRGQTDANGVEVRDHICHFEWARTKQGVPPLPAALARPLTALVTSSQFSIPSSRLKPGVNSLPFTRHRERMPRWRIFQKVFLN